MPHSNAELIARFYDALARRDAAAMAACYHPQATFSDPVFPDLDHDAAVAMWTMLCSRGSGVGVEASGIQADDRQGRAHLRASYLFSATGRRVVNEIDSTFTFRDGLIARQEDRFDLRRWIAQAFGPVGAAIGWLPPVQGALRRRFAATLSAWRAKHGM